MLRWVDLKSTAALIGALISNLVDNAIEACNKIDENNIEKYITIKSTFIKGYEHNFVATIHIPVE